MSSPDAFAVNLGEALVGAMLAVVGWIMNTFTKRHLESMDKLTDRIGSVAQDVATMKADISALRHSQEVTEHRVERLEHDKP